MSISSDKKYSLLFCHHQSRRQPDYDEYRQPDRGCTFTRRSRCAAYDGNVVIPTVKSFINEKKGENYDG